MELVISDISDELGTALLERARSHGKSLDQIAVEALSAYVQHKGSTSKRDLSFMGSLSEQDAKAIEEAHAFCDQIGAMTEPAK